MKVFSGYLIILLLSAVNFVAGLKVLGILPFGSKSHFAIGSSIVDSLHAVGHDITVNCSNVTSERSLKMFKSTGDLAISPSKTQRKVSRCRHVCAFKRNGKRFIE
jgi:hypothetical protein